MHKSDMIPNKHVKIRNSDPCWLNTSIKKLMRKRKRLYDKYKRTKSSVDFENYKHIRNKVITEIRRSKDNENNILADKLKSNILGPKDWWKTLKHFIKPTSTSSIPPLCTLILMTWKRQKYLTHIFKHKIL